MKKAHLFALLFLVLTVSCSKEYSCEKCIPGTLTYEGTVIYSGPPELDGCGWMIMVGNNYFFADNLTNEFKEDGMVILFDYDLTGQTSLCGFNPTPYPIVHITAIQKK